MGSPISASLALQLPVRLHGIQLGRPTDLLLDTAAWHAIGFVVLCGDESTRFLPYAACQPSQDELRVASALLLLEDVEFYATRGVSYRSLLMGEVIGGGLLGDLILGHGGEIVELEVEREGELVRIASAGAVVVPTRATAA